MALSAGTRLGPYEIVAPLGAGGMGEVWRARDPRLGRDVAVKVVHPRLASDPDRLSRFEKEARAAAQLDHPNILVVHDVGTHEGSPFIVSELLSGESLREKLGAPLPPKKAVDYAIQIAHGLAAAHEKGIVHRDIKPENVFVTKDGHVKILDFGVAKLLPSFEHSGVDTETPTATATQAGTAVGTVAYMSPEQIRGQPVDARTDIFSLGVVLYEMLSGRRPFQRDTPAEIMTAILREEPADLSETNRSVPAALENVVRHCLEREPDVRFQSARDVVFALEGLPDVSSTKPVAPMSPAGVWLHRRRTSLAGSALLFAVLATGMLVLKLRSAGPSARPAGPSIAVLPFTNLSEDKSQEYFSDGLSEEVMGLLTRVKNLKVTGRTSSFAFKGKNEDLRSIGQKLNVATVLEGSVRRSGDQLRVSTQLVNVADGYQIWAETFDRKLTDIFTVQDEIAAAVVAALKIQLLPHEVPRSSGSRTANPEAYRQYLLGRYFFTRGNLANDRSSVESYQKAISLDPRFAAAYAGLAISEALSADILSEDAAGLDRARQQALAAATTALSLDPSLADGYMARGYLRSTVSWDWAGAQADLERALAIDPGDPEAHTQYSTILASLGRLPDAIKEATVATDLDPLSAEAWIVLGSELRVAPQLAYARRALSRAIEIVPDSDRAHSFLGSVSILEGRPAAALIEFARSDVREGSRLLGVAIAEHDLGHSAASQHALDTLIAKYAHTWAVQIADIYAWRGEANEAFSWLDRAYAYRDGGLADLKFDPYLAKLRDDARFTALLKKVGLPTG